MEIKTLATRVAVLTALRDSIDDVITGERSAVSSELIDLSKAFGVKALDIELPNGVLVASITLSTSEPKAIVDSDIKLVQWVKANAPTEIVQSVRDSYKKVLLDRLIDSGDGVAVDPNTGLIVEGVTFRESSPRMTLRFKKEGREQVAEAYNAGELDGVIRPLLGAPLKEIGQVG